ncbi:protein SCO1/2 [Hydrogenivirga caldilitoris]|uniref:Protein SCO1/2 n=1 Tax=Hydrogenivirga caldilitoris TaxID=246264 RepID=A0A497XQP9_9AQUI|nr:SCO family protein [Hydrogenivirga caldilitoris]RLJ71285.1 protein SCO1/2 [Hydrogenivirga caldilitoris]
MSLLAPLVSLLLLFLFSFSQTGGTGIPPNESRTLGNRVPDVLLVDSEGTEFNLYSLRGKPVIISPVYTHCTSACPIITESLKKVIKLFGEVGKDFYILTLTFDPQDTVPDLKSFAEKHGLNYKGWKVVLVRDRTQLFKLLDAIDFRFATLPNRDFVHPNLIVFLDKDMVIRKYMYGVTFDKLEFANALRIARGEVALPEKFRGYLFLLGMLGFTGTIVFTIVRLTQIRYRRKAAA